MLYFWFSQLEKTMKNSITILINITYRDFSLIIIIMYDLKNCLSAYNYSVIKNPWRIVFEYFMWNILTSEKYTWCHQTGDKSWCGLCVVQNSKRVFSILSSLPIKSIANNSHFTLIGCNNPQMKDNLFSVCSNLLNVILVTRLFFRQNIFGLHLNEHDSSVTFLLWYWSKMYTCTEPSFVHVRIACQKLSDTFIVNLKRFEWREKILVGKRQSLYISFVRVRNHGKKDSFIFIPLV